MNSPTEGPELAQIVSVRDIGEDAQIAHLEMTDQARATVGHELVFTAIHRAARHGIHRLYSPGTVAHVEPFGFTAVSTDRPGMVVYNMTSQDMNWPRSSRRTLPHDADVTVGHSAIQCRSAGTTECLITVSEHARTIDRHAARVFAKAISRAERQLAIGLGQ